MGIFRKKKEEVVPTPTQVSRVVSDSVKLDSGYTRNVAKTTKRYLEFLVKYNPHCSYRELMSDFDEFCSSGRLNRYDLSAWFYYTSNFKESEREGLMEFFESSNGVKVGICNDYIAISYDSYAYTIPIKDLKVSETKLEFPTGVLRSDGNLSIIYARSAYDE